MTLDQARGRASIINGWLTDKEGETLYLLASSLQGKGAVVEIGSWQGKSTVFLAGGISASLKKPKLYAVDPHTGSKEHRANGEKIWTYDIFIENMRKASVADAVQPIVKSSADFASEMDEPVELIFIDGAHDCKSVSEDIAAWFPKVINGGIMAFHDTYPGGDPYKILRKSLYFSRRFGPIRTADSMTYAVKVERNHLLVWTRNILMVGRKDMAHSLRKVPLMGALTKRMRKIYKNRK